jgi:hypothetical protein
MSNTAAGLQVEAVGQVTGPIDSWQIRLTVAETPVGTRSALSSTRESISGLVRSFPGGGAIVEGQTRSLSMRAGIGRRAAGAYPARLELISARRVLTTVEFFVVMLATSETRATPVTWLWPLIDRPHRGVDGVFLDDVLATQLGVSGRLQTLVARGTNQPVVWVIDPALIAAIEDMSDGYQLLEDEQRVDREPSPDAARWLENLRIATSSREVVVLPYGDPDLHTLARVDANRLATAHAEGIRILARVLDRAPATLITDVAWPSTGRVSR